jgi:hypothetical protein
MEFVANCKQKVGSDTPTKKRIAKAIATLIVARNLRSGMSGMKGSLLEYF